MALLLITPIEALLGNEVSCDTMEYTPYFTHIKQAAYP